MMKPHEAANDIKFQSQSVLQFYACNIHAHDKTEMAILQVLKSVRFH